MTDHMTYIVMLSGGVSSFEAARRTIQRYPNNDIQLWFADTRTEDEDLYRFLADTETFFGLPIRRFDCGADVWDVFDRERMIGNTRADLCSRILKREPLWKARASEFTPDNCISILGLDWTEPHRINKSISAHHPWRIEFPLDTPPLWTKIEVIDAMKLLGLKPPRLTSMGFPHNNCGGFCVKAGQAQFAQLLRVFPERYAYHERREREWQVLTGKNNTVLRDRRGGQTTPLSLTKFRSRVQQGMFDETDWGGCGCFTQPDN